MSIQRQRRPGTIAALPAVTLVGVMLFGGAAPAAAGEQSNMEKPPEPEGGISNYQDSIRPYDPQEFIRSYDPADFIESLGSAESEDEDVIVLETDILFVPMKWSLPSGADARISELVEEVPDGAAVEVSGHTDSNPVPDGHDFDNQVLSERRAQAVADVLAEERSDLQLSVEGFGEDQPAVEEDEDDPDTFAANRRVEIRYD